MTNMDNAVYQQVENNTLRLIKSVWKNMERVHFCGMIYDHKYIDCDYENFDGESYNEDDFYQEYRDKEFTEIIESSKEFKYFNDDYKRLFHNDIRKYLSERRDTVNWHLVKSVEDITDVIKCYLYSRSPILESVQSEDLQ